MNINNTKSIIIIIIIVSKTVFFICIIYLSDLFCWTSHFVSAEEIFVVVDARHGFLLNWNIPSALDLNHQHKVNLSQQLLPYSFDGKHKEWPLIFEQAEAHQWYPTEKQMWQQDKKKKEHLDMFIHDSKYTGHISVTHPLSRSLQFWEINLTVNKICVSGPITLKPALFLWGRHEDTRA